MARSKSQQGNVKSPAKKRRTTKKAPTTASGVHLDSKNIFPFLKLPGEVRNIIYEYALVEEDDSITFSQRVENGRRCPIDSNRSAKLVRFSNGTLQDGGSYLAWYTPFEELSVALLQTCKQINYEAAAIFYGKNEFLFRNEISCARFLQHFHSRVPLLRHLRLDARGPWPLRRNPNKTFKHDIILIFDSLRRATNLEAFDVDDEFWGMLSCSPFRAAKAFYHAAAPWMHDLNDKYDNKLAILDIMEMPRMQEHSSDWYLSKDILYERSSFQRPGQPTFRKQLKKRMTLKGSKKSTKRK